MPEAAAGERAKASSEQVDLDTEELRELEHDAYYPEEPPVMRTTGGGIVGRLRVLLGRRTPSSGQGE